MNARPETSIVRIFTPEGVVVGAGFLVAETTLLTCAHVVAAALNLKEYPSQPSIEISLDLKVSIDFPLILPEQKFTAQVVQLQPPQSNDGGDIAVLHLNSQPPTGAKFARLVVSDDLWGHDFRAFGFPSYHDNGVWASGKLDAAVATGWIQIVDVKDTGYHIQPGFSGGAVWDEQLDGVVGMTVAAEEDPTIRAAYMIPARVLINAYSPLAQQAIPSCPYRGLSAFREQDELFFFGRELFAEQMVDAVQSKPFLAIIGPSGSGKSSVVYAGLLPHLRRNKDWIITSLRPGNRPFHSLAAALVPLLGLQISEVEVLTEISKLAKQFQIGDVSLRDVVERLLEKNQGSRLLLVIDQFEELYTLCQESETRNRFLDELISAVQLVPQSRTPLLRCFTLVLTLRADFFGQALSYPPFVDALQHNDLKLGPMNLDELNDAITEPANRLQVKLETGLAQRILEELHDSSQLPLLEFAMTLLWDRQQDNMLTHAAYDEIGGVEQALAEHAEAVYADLSEDDQSRVRQVFVQLVRPGEGTEDTRRLATRIEVGEDNWELVMRLASARLVVTAFNEITNEETVEVVHEALIQRWRRLQGWINTDRAFLSWHEKFRVSMRQWQESQQDDGLLLRGASLIETKVWLEKRGQELNTKEKEYLFHSILNEGSDTQKWLPQYWKIEEIFASLDRYRVSVDEDDRLKAIEALRWSPHTDQDIKVFQQLKTIVLEDISSSVRNSAALSICERGNISELTALLASPDLSKNERQQLVQVLAYLRNLPKTGREMAKVLRYSKRRVLLSATLQIIANYRNQFAIIIFFSYILGQIVMLATGEIISDFHPFGSNSSSTTNLVNANVYLLNIVVTLTIGTYIMIRKIFIDEGKVTIRECIYAALLSLLTFDLIQYIFYIIASNITHHNPFPIGSVFYWLQSIFVADMAGLLIIALCLRVNFAKRSVLWKFLLIALLSSGFESTLQIILVPEILKLEGESVVFLSTYPSNWLAISISIVSNNSSIIRSTLSLWLVTFLCAFACLLGFWFGVYSAFIGKTRLNQSLPLLSSVTPAKLAREQNKSKLAFWSNRNIMQPLILLGIVGLVIAGGFFSRELIAHSLMTYHLDSVDITSALWSPDSKYLAASGSNNTVEVWDLDSGKTRYVYQGQGDETGSVVWSPDGKYLAGNFDNSQSSSSNSATVEVWDATSGKSLYIFRNLLSFYGNSSNSQSLFWSPDSMRLAAVGYDKIVEVLDATSGKTLIYGGHPKSIDQLEWSRDGKHLATASDDGTIQVRDAATGNTILSYYISGIVNVAWSPDSKHIICVSQDGTVQVSQSI